MIFFFCFIKMILYLYIHCQTELETASKGLFHLCTKKWLIGAHLCHQKSLFLLRFKHLSCLVFHLPYCRSVELRIPATDQRECICSVWIWERGCSSDERGKHQWLGCQRKHHCIVLATEQNGRILAMVVFQLGGKKWPTVVGTIFNMVHSSTVCFI